jgi:hypothetical protein
MDMKAKLLESLIENLAEIPELESMGLKKKPEMEMPEGMESMMEGESEGEEESQDSSDPKSLKLAIIEMAKKKNAERMC